jgi:hypothetical protein
MVRAAVPPQKKPTGVTPSASSLIEQSGHVHRRQWSRRSKHEVRVPPHRRREHHKCNNNDPELTHFLETKQKPCQFYEALHKLEAADTVWIYADTNKEVGDVDHLKVFATPELADEWFKENEPEGDAFGYGVIEE